METSEPLSAEEWRPVPSAPGVFASSLGRIKVSAQAKPRLGTWSKGRYIIGIKRLGKTFRVARLVCEAFRGPPPFPGALAMHDDEDSKNNRPGNLLWGTAKQNLNYPGFIAHCRSRRGALSARAIWAARRRGSTADQKGGAR